MKNTIFFLAFLVILCLLSTGYTQSKPDWVWYSVTDIGNGIETTNYFDNNSLLINSKNNTVYFTAKNEYSKPKYDQHYNKKIVCTVIETMLYCEEKKLADFKIKIIFSDDTFKEVDFSKNLFKYPVKAGTETEALYNTLCK